MRRPAIALITVAVAIGAAAGAGAAPKPKPVKITQYFHGTSAVGEVDTPPGKYTLTMDATKPTGTSAKSKGVTNYVGGPNTQCAGNSLFPVWQGNLSGAVTQATVVFYAQGTGGSVDVRLFADIDAQMCNDSYPKVGGSATVVIPAGPAVEVKVPIKLSKLAPKRSLMVQISPTLTAAGLLITPFVERVQYDAASALSRIELTCTPATGKKTC